MYSHYCLTNDRFKIDYDAPIGEVDFGNGKGFLSSGYQAIIRILLELLYYQDMEIKVNAPQYAWVVIDELESSKTIKRINQIKVHIL